MASSSFWQSKSVDGGRGWLSGAVGFRVDRISLRTLIVSWHTLLTSVDNKPRNGCRTSSLVLFVAMFVLEKRPTTEAITDP